MRAISHGISPESEPITGTPHEIASTIARPNCSFHFGVVCEGITSTSSCAYPLAIRSWVRSEITRTREPGIGCPSSCSRSSPFPISTSSTGALSARTAPSRSSSPLLSMSLPA